MSIVDLSTHHGYLTDRFPRPVGVAEWSAFLLDEVEVEAFHRDGYTAGIEVLTNDQVDWLCDSFERLMDLGPDDRDRLHEYHSSQLADPGKVLFHALGAWRASEAFHDLLWHPAISVPAAQLLKGGVRLWHDQVLCESARHTGVVNWHQDYSSWRRTKPIAHLSCWIALDDTGSEDAWLQYIPGSHRWNLLPETDLAGDIEVHQEELTSDQGVDFQPVAVPLRRGQASFHHALTIYGAGAHTVPNPRRATVVNLCRDGTRSDSEAPLLEGIPVIPPGVPLEGRFFPLLFDPQVVGLPIL